MISTREETILAGWPALKRPAHGVCSAPPNGVKKLGGVAGFVLMFSVGAVALAGKADVLDSAAAEAAQRPPIAFVSVSDDYYSDSAASKADWRGISVQGGVYEIRQDGERFEVLSQKYTRGEQGQIKPLADSHTYWDGERRWGSHFFKGVPSESHSVDEKADTYQLLLSGEDYGAFLEGRFPHYTEGDWTKTLGEKPCTVVGDTTELVGEHACYVVEASTHHGDYRLWIDPAAGYLLRRAIIVLDEDDLAWGHKLSEPRGRRKIVLASRMELEIRDVVIAEFDGHFVSTSGTLHKKYFDGDGTTREMITHIQRENIEVNPDFDWMGAFTFDFPEGAPVTQWFEDDSHLRYVWRNGNLVPDMDLGTITAIDDLLSSKVLPQEEAVGTHTVSLAPSLTSVLSEVQAVPVSVASRYTKLIPYLVLCACLTVLIMRILVQPSKQLKDEHS